MTHNSGVIRLHSFPFISPSVSREPLDRVLFKSRKKFSCIPFHCELNSVSMDMTGVLNCLFVIVVLMRSVITSLISTKVDLCGPILELVLDQFEESSATIAFAANEYTSACKLKITAPETHVVYINIVDTIPEELQRELSRTSRSESCQLDVYQHGGPELVWSGDPCSHQTLSDIDLLHPEVVLEWTPPADASHVKGKKLLVTAVGRGDTCKDSLQHTCMSIGYEPLFCVSKYLLCDGNQNCPRGATKNDEDDRLCKITLSIFFKQFKHPEVNERILNVLLSKTTKSPKIYPIWQDWTYWNDEATTSLPSSTTVETQTTNIESLSAALSHYGPWGYILLGLLICGTVLMFCGVWECFKKPKPPAEPAQAVPPNATTTTTVLIIQEEDNSPPSYDDLEPPSYSMLFPNVKEDEPVVAENARAPVARMDGQNRQNQDGGVSARTSNEDNAVIQNASGGEQGVSVDDGNSEDTGQDSTRCEPVVDTNANTSNLSVSVTDSSVNDSNLTTNNSNNNNTATV